MARKGKPENLKPFKKGDEWEGNRNGRPRKLPDLRELMDEVCGGDEMADIVKAQIKKAKSGDSRAAELVLAYGFGKPKQQVEHTGKDDGPIENKILVITKPNDGSNGDASQP